MTMSDLVWGLQMMLVGMGVVFGLLIALMALLMLIGRLDRQPREAMPEVHQQPTTAEVTVMADGLNDEQLAAIAIAVMTHAEVRRRSAAPEMRAHAPGSQLFASRWVSIGRGRQHTRFRRR